ncbi:MAG: hypothetical protein ACE5JL_16155, partial [Dehalococcoidia bacterium]
MCCFRSIQALFIGRYSPGVSFELLANRMYITGFSSVNRIYENCAGKQRSRSPFDMLSDYVESLDEQGIIGQDE